MQTSVFSDCGDFLGAIRADQEIYPLIGAEFVGFVSTSVTHSKIGCSSAEVSSIGGGSNCDRLGRLRLRPINGLGETSSLSEARYTVILLIFL
jgi:hypothetical protein